MPTVPLLAHVPEGFSFQVPSHHDPNGIVRASVVRRDCDPLSGAALHAVSDAAAGNSWALARWGPNLRKRLYANFGITAQRDPSESGFDARMRDAARDAAQKARDMASNLPTARRVQERECVRSLLSGEYHPQ